MTDENDPLNWPTPRPIILIGGVADGRTFDDWQGDIVKAENPRPLPALKPGPARAARLKPIFTMIYRATGEMRGGREVFRQVATK